MLDQILALIRPLTRHTLPVAIGFALLAGMVFINSADFQGAESQAESFKFKYQIYFRLLTCAACGLYGAKFFPLVWQRLTAFPGVLVLIYGAVVLGTLPFSIDAKYSFVATGCLWCLLLFLPAVTTQLSNTSFLLALMIGTTAYVSVCWVLYFLFPEIGVWREFITIDYYLQRMGGLGHPNALGFYATSALLLTCLLQRRNVFHLAMLAAMFFFWAGTMYFCLSRTSILLAMIGAIGIYWDILFPQLFQRSTILRLSALAIAGCGFLLSLSASGEFEYRIEQAMLSTSKSGDAEELTSFTGRSDIWAYGWQQITERPVTGYGYGAQRFVMEEHSYHCHNILLNALMGNGVFAGLSIAGMLLWLVYQLAVTKEPFLRGFVPLFLLGGIIESMIYSPAPDLNMVLFFSLVLWYPDGDKEPVARFSRTDFWQGISTTSTSSAGA